MIINYTLFGDIIHLWLLGGVHMILLNVCGFAADPVTVQSFKDIKTAKRCVSTTSKWVKKRWKKQYTKNRRFGI